MTQSATPDEIAIWQLLCRYCHLVDRGDMADVVGLFHPEGTLVFPPSPPAKGQEAIRQAYDSWLRTAREPTVWLRHQINTPLIDVAGDGATAVSYFTADFLLRKKGRVQALVGRYQDELARHQGRWSLWRREIRVDARLDFGEPQ
jgi:uncharacterized protein (TIGR02246 family)